MRIDRKKQQHNNQRYVPRRERLWGQCRHFGSPLRISSAPPRASSAHRNAQRVRLLHPGRLNLNVFS